jgi:DUF971 family protein
MNPHAPAHIDLKKDRGLTILWADGTSSYFSIHYLRRMSPSADMRELRKSMHANPLTVLPANFSADSIVATDAELVGNYAIRITFSDGHASGIYTWDYLRELDPETANPKGRAPGDDSPRHDNPLGLGP